METKRRRRQRQPITLEELKNDPNSLLSWGIEDPALCKLETYRLYQAGYAAADLAAAFEMSREYLYEVWAKFKSEGTTALVDKRWGAEPRKLTSEIERAILRAKALTPHLSDGQLGESFGLDRSSIYHLLKEHGLQDLHRVLADNPGAEGEPGETEGDEEKNVEIIPCAQALYLTLLNALEQTGFADALEALAVAQPADTYTDEKLRLATVLLQAAGVSRISHINDQPLNGWGVPLDSARRPDGDTLDRYLQAIIALDEGEGGPEAAAARLGQIRAEGMIAAAQAQSLRNWVSAGLLDGTVWHFDGHTIEYTGVAEIGKTKHGTKEKSVKAVDRYTLSNGLVSLTDVFPVRVTYDEALRQMVPKVNAALPPDQPIRHLCFDKEGWDAETLGWLRAEQQIDVITWVKNTPNNVNALAAVPDDDFVATAAGMTVGKAHKAVVQHIADTRVDLPHLGESRVVILETEAEKRIGIYTTAPPPATTSLSDESCLSTVDILEGMRLQQRLENSFKVDIHEMGSDHIPTQRTFTVTRSEPYDLEAAAKQQRNAQKRLVNYTAQIEHDIPQLQEETSLDKHSANLLQKRASRLQTKAQRQLAALDAEMAAAIVDEAGQATLTTTCEVLDLRKLTLLSLFKAHALVALTLLARQLGLDGAGPNRLRRQFLAFGNRVEFDAHRGIATVYAGPFPRATTQQAYERFCDLAHDLPIPLRHQGVLYRLRFSW